MARASDPSRQPDTARAAVAGLDLIGVAAAALARTGRSIALNAHFERLMPDVAQERGSRLRLADTMADAILADAVARIGSERDPRRARLIPVPASGAHPPIIMQLIAIRGPVRDVLAPVHAVLIAVPLAAKEPPAAAVLQGLFDLTPAEARVARAVAQRQTIAAAAKAFGLSPETVRSQLRAALAKAGLARKGDLAAMLAGLPLQTGGRG